MIELEGGLAQGLHGRDEDGHVFGLASGHHRIDGKFFGSDEARSLGQVADDEIVSLLARMVENVVFALDGLDSEAERKKNERAARRLARMYAALSATNEAIIRSKSPQELYERICDASVRGGKSIATAVLLAEPDAPWLKAVAGSGDVMELVKITRFSIDPDSPYGGGVVGQAFRDRKLAINADILNSEQGRPWREAGLAVNAVACAAAPLTKKGQSIGVLMIFFGKSWAADEEVMALLARLAENISFALDNFEREDERKRAETRAHHLATTTISPICPIG